MRAVLRAFTPAAILGASSGVLRVFISNNSKSATRTLQLKAFTSDKVLINTKVQFRSRCHKKAINIYTILLENIPKLTQFCLEISQLSAKFGLL